MSEQKETKSSKTTRRTRNLGEIKLCLATTDEFGTSLTPLEELYTNLPKPEGGYKDIADAESHLKAMIDPTEPLGLLSITQKYVNQALGNVKTHDALPNGEYVIIREVKRIKVGSVTQRTYEEIPTNIQDTDSDTEQEELETMPLPEGQLPESPESLVVPTASTHPKPTLEKGLEF